MRKKDLAAIELGAKRWHGVSAQERQLHAKMAVGVREAKKRAGRIQMKLELENAPLPTWLKMRLREAERVIRGSDGRMKDYADAGYHLGRYHLDDFNEDRDLVYEADEDEVVGHPSRVLRR